jgi:hypothetical protein
MTFATGLNRTHTSLTAPWRAAGADRLALFGVFIIRHHRSRLWVERRGVPATVDEAEYAVSVNIDMGMNLHTLNQQDYAFGLFVG